MNMPVYDEVKAAFEAAVRGKRRTARLQAVPDLYQRSKDRNRLQKLANTNGYTLKIWLAGSEHERYFQFTLAPKNKTPLKEAVEQLEAEELEI